MKKNRTMRAAALLLALTLITSCFVGGTFAKYTSEFVGGDSARVAEWAFSVDSTKVELLGTKSFTFEVFKTALDENGATEYDVAKNDDVTIIAPGTMGYVVVSLRNDSEVDATYKVAFTAEEAGVPLYWSIDGNTWNDAVASCDVSTTEIDMKASKEIKLFWKWNYNPADGWTDEKDTSLGVAASAQPNVTATVTVEQVN